MVSFQIMDVKAFMEALLKKETFDEFSLVELEIKTFFTVKLEGRRLKEWYGEDGEDFPSEFLEWKEVKPMVYRQIRGKRAPLSIKAVLQLNGEPMDRFVQGVDSSYSPEEVVGLILNVQYERETLGLTTGVSLRGFHPDQRLSHAWDEEVRKLLQKHELYGGSD